MYLMRRALVLLAVIGTACVSDSPDSGWVTVERASGSVPGSPGVMECRWNLPCKQVRTGSFSTTGQPLRLVCSGTVDLDFVEYLGGPEPSSGNSRTCPAEGASSILLFPAHLDVIFYLDGARVSARTSTAQLPWSVSLQEWQGRWRRPDCQGARPGIPRGPWALCGDGPLGIALPAPTPPG